MSGLPEPDHHDYVLQTFRTAFNVLSREDDLSPRNVRINQSLGAFVRAVLDCECANDCDLLAHEDVQALRQPMIKKLAQAEFLMEKFYADPAMVQLFPYHKNYRDLVREEIRTLRMVNTGQRGHAVFIGSGPLPLTAIEFYRQTGQFVQCVEKDPVAAQMSRRLIRHYGLDHAISIVEGDGSEIDYRGAQLIIVAALADGKEAIMKRIQRTAPGAILGVRSAEGLRTLLYDEVDAGAIIKQGYNFGGKSRTSNDIINTTLMFSPA